MGHAGGVRLMMFNAPMLYLVTGAGIAAIFDWLWRRDLVGIENKTIHPPLTLTLSPQGERGN